ncbi:unnamed protein product, partial [Iphiclides podalirius]
MEHYRYPFQGWTNQPRQYVNFTVNQEGVTMDRNVHTDMSVATVQWSASIGLEDSVKKAISVNSSTSMICLKCQNVISMPDLMPVTIKNVHFYTLIPRAKSKIVHGMIEVFADMVHTAGTGMCEESSV